MRFGFLKKLLRRSASVGRYAWNRAMAERIPDSAAAATYYALFSLFPLLMITIVIGSFFLDSAYVMERVLDTISAFIPSASRQLILGNIMQIIENRGSVSALGTLGLLWGASGIFITIQDNLSRAWPETRLRNILKARLVGIAMVAAFFFLLIAFSILEAVAGLVYEWFDREFGIPFLYKYISRIVLYVFIFFSYFMLYRWVPNADIEWPEALGGAVFATVVSQLFTAAFGWFLGSGLNRYNLVYGSLGTLITFMFWVFVMNFVLLGGGHVSAAMARERRGVEKR